MINSQGSHFVGSFQTHAGRRALPLKLVTSLNKTDKKEKAKEDKSCIDLLLAILLETSTVHILYY